MRACVAEGLLARRVGSHERLLLADTAALRGFCFVVYSAGFG